LRLRQRQAESRDFGVLGSNSTRELVFRVCTRSDFEKSVQQWHDKTPPLPVLDTSEARNVARAAHERVVERPWGKKAPTTPPGGSAQWGQY
jgi:hypothetical protein